MAILSTKRPISQLWDGDAHQYIIDGKLDFEGVTYPNTDWEDTPQDEVHATILPASGMVFIGGSAIALQAPAAAESLVCTLPKGYWPSKGMTIPVTLGQAADTYKTKTVKIQTNGEIYTEDDGVVVDVGNRLYLDSIQFTPAPFDGV
jgi:hypothetical protein